MSDRARLLRSILRTDLPSFIRKGFLTLEPGRPYLDNWHIRHLAWQLDRVARGEVRRLIINIPPRYAKSLVTSICWPAFLLGQDPSRRIMCVSHTTGLARAHAVQFSNLVQAEWFRELFPRFDSLRARNRDVEFMTSLHGYRTAFAMTGGILGRGADIIIIDDPMRGEAAYSAAERRRAKEVFDGTISTRLNNKEQGAIVLVMQRLHSDYLVSHVLAQEEWEVISIPAIAIEARTYQLGILATDLYERTQGALLQPEREGPQTMEVMRRRLGSQGFAAQYQQQPVPQDGAVIRRDWIRYYGAPPVSFDLTIASWDTASTLGERSDYSVGTVWGLRDGQFYLLDLVRGRFEVPELRRRIIELRRDNQRESAASIRMRMPAGWNAGRA